MAVAPATNKKTTHSGGSKSNMARNSELPAARSRRRWKSSRHGIALETVIPLLEDETDYQRFEAAIRSGYRPRSPIEHHLLGRLASLLWRLRRATLIETGLFAMQGPNPDRNDHELRLKMSHPSLGVLYQILAEPKSFEFAGSPGKDDPMPSDTNRTAVSATRDPVKPHHAFLHFSTRRVLERLGRYELGLWKQTAQVLVLLDGKGKKISGAHSSIDESSA